MLTTRPETEILEDILRHVESKKPKGKTFRVLVLSGDFKDVLQNLRGKDSIYWRMASLIQELGGKVVNVQVGVANSAEEVFMEVDAGRMNIAKLRKQLRERTRN